MNNVHAIIYAYHGYKEMGALGAHRTGASMPFSARFRLVDFALSSMMNAGIHNVGVIMQQGYQSLLDHVGNGRAWDMAKHIGGLSLLPPYGLPTSSKGVYSGNMDALAAVREYLVNIKEEYIVLERGDLCANVDVEKLVEQHLSTGVDITAVCVKEPLPYIHHNYLLGPDGLASELLCMVDGNDDGYSTLEMYVMSKKVLLDMVDWCSARGRIHFHRDGMQHMMRTGCKVGVYLHEGYARHIVSVPDYYQANMDMLDPEKRATLFPDERHVSTPSYIDVSAYYGPNTNVKNSIISDGCIIEGTVENSILFAGAKVDKGAVIRNCIILNDTDIKEGVKLDYVIADKNILISPYVTLTGAENMPLVIPKGKKI